MLIAPACTPQTAQSASTGRAKPASLPSAPAHARAKTIVHTIFRTNILLFSRVGPPLGRLYRPDARRDRFIPASRPCNGVSVRIPDHSPVFQAQGGEQPCAERNPD